LKIVGVISVRDEVELIAANIAYHLSLGFTGIVVADILSVDGTTEALELFKDDPRVKVISAPSQNWNVFDWRQVLVELAKEEFQPDLITHIDPDEFLYAPDHRDINSISFDSDQLSILRFNCVSCMDPDFVPPMSMEEADDLTLVRHPKLTHALQAQDENPAAWIYTGVGPKVLCKASKISKFIGGSHSAVDDDGKPLTNQTSGDFLFLHFPFTSYDRFLRKIENLNNLMDTLAQQTSPGYAYHWKYWVQMYRENGEAAIQAEFKKQLAAIAGLENNDCHEIAKNFRDFDT
jgi:hypothetical protein